MENNQINGGPVAGVPSQDPAQTQNSMNDIPVAPVPVVGSEQPPRNKIKGWQKTLMIVGGIVVGVIILAIIIIVVVSATSKKLDCSSTQGNITIMYNDDTLTGYAANGIGYNLDEQKAITKQIGVGKYIERFVDWFEINTDGTCTKR